MEVGISIKVHRDQIGEDLGRGTFLGSDTHMLDFSGMCSLVSVQRFM